MPSRRAREDGNARRAATGGSANVRARRRCYRAAGLWYAPAMGYRDERDALQARGEDLEAEVAKARAEADQLRASTGVRPRRRRKTATAAGVLVNERDALQAREQGLEQELAEVRVEAEQLRRLQQELAQP